MQGGRLAVSQHHRVNHLCLNQPEALCQVPRTASLARALKRIPMSLFIEQEQRGGLENGTQGTAGGGGGAWN